MYVSNYILDYCIYRSQQVESPTFVVFGIHKPMVITIDSESVKVWQAQFCNSAWNHLSWLTWCCILYLKQNHDDFNIWLGFISSFA